MITRLDDRRRVTADISPEVLDKNVLDFCERFGLEPPPDADATDTEESGFTRFFRSSWYVELFAELGGVVARRSGAASWMVSALPFLLASGFVASIWASQYWVAAAMLILAAPFEMLDGFVARRTKNPRRMVFLDYIFDRLGDIVIFGGLAINLMGVDALASALALAVLITALTASYARAQAEALHFRGTSHFGRFARLFTMTVMALGIAILGGFDNTTAVLFTEYALGLLLGLTAAVLIRRTASLLTSTADFSANLRWDEGEWLPRLLTELTQANEGPATVVVSSAESPKYGTVIHLQRSESGRLWVSSRRGRVPVDRVG